MSPREHLSATEPQYFYRPEDDRTIDYCVEQGSVALFYRDTRGLTLLTSEEERQLGLVITEGRRATAQLGSFNNLPAELSQKLESQREKGFRARNELVQHNYRLVGHWVRRILPFVSSAVIEKSDLIQSGNLALVVSAGRFHPDRGRFSTLASVAIHNRIRNALDSEGWVLSIPYRAHMDRRRIMRATESLMTQRIPLNLESLVEATGLPFERVVDALQIPLSYPLDYEDHEGDGEPNFPSAPPAENVALAGIEEELAREEVVDLLSKATPKQGRIIELRLGLKDGNPRTEEETAKIIGTSHQNVHTMEHNGYNRIRLELDRVPVPWARQKRGARK